MGQNIGALKIDKAKVVTDDKWIAQALRNFSPIYSKRMISVIRISGDKHQKSARMNTFIETIVKSLAKLNNNNNNNKVSLIPDGVPPCFLKQTASTTSVPLAIS